MPAIFLQVLAHESRATESNQFTNKRASGAQFLYLRDIGLGLFCTFLFGHPKDGGLG